MKTLMTLLALLVAALLAGCKLNMPAFDSASVEVHSGGHVVTTGVLQQSQVKALQEWLIPRKAGWEHRLESTAPALLVRLEHRGKVVAQMNIMQHQVKIGDHFRRITSEERDMLHLLRTTFLPSKKEANKAPEPTPTAAALSMIERSTNIILCSRESVAAAGVAHL